MKLRRKVMGLVALSSLAIALAGCEDHSAEKVGKTIDQTVGKAEDVLDDAIIIMKIEMALAREPDLKALQMNVDTANEHPFTHNSIHPRRKPLCEPQRRWQTL